MKVSVIIPVYNGEQHLRQCLDSVCGQTLRDIEIICVDDGSTDSSPEILREYQAKDERIRIFTQQNLYAGAARNLGKAHAGGEYVIFWDSDDFFEPEALQMMYERAAEQQADICVCGANQYLQDVGKLVPYVRYMDKKKIPKESVFNRSTNEDYILNFTNGATWNKMYCRAFLEAIELDFPAARNGEDEYFTANALCLAKRITAIENRLINYRSNQEQSLVGTVSKDPLAPIHAWIAAAENLKAHDAFPERSFANKAAGSMIYLLHNLRETQAFYEAVRFLKEEGLQKLHLIPREEEYYYNKRYGEVVNHMTQDSVQDFQTFFSYLTYMQMRETVAQKNINREKVKQKKAELAEAKKQGKAEKKALELQIQEMKAQHKKEMEQLQTKLSKIEHSYAYRIGRKIVWLPGKIMRFLRGKKKES